MQFLIIEITVENKWKNSMEPFLIKMLYTTWNLCFSKTGGEKKENKKLYWPRLLLGAMWARPVRKGQLLGAWFQNQSCLTKKAAPLQFWKAVNEHSTTLALQRSRPSPSRWAYYHASSPEKQAHPSRGGHLPASAFSAPHMQYRIFSLHMLSSSQSFHWSFLTRFYFKANNGPCLRVQC